MIHTATDAVFRLSFSNVIFSKQTSAHLHCDEAEDEISETRFITAWKNKAKTILMAGYHWG